MTQISTETLAAKAPAGVTVTEYRGYQLIDNDDYVAICRNAAIVQCAHTPAQAQQDIDELIAATPRKVITTYRKFEMRENAHDGIGVDIVDPATGKIFWFEPNVALAKSFIDREIAHRASQNVQPQSQAVQSAPVAPSALTAAERKAANARKLGRAENNPDDLI